MPAKSLSIIALATALAVSSSAIAQVYEDDTSTRPPAGEQAKQGGPNFNCIGGALLGGLLAQKLGAGGGAIGAAISPGCSGNAPARTGAAQIPAQNGFPRSDANQTGGFAAFAPKCMAQWNSAARGQKPIGGQTHAALSKVEGMLQASAASVDAAEARYAQAAGYQADTTPLGGANPLAAILGGGSTPSAQASNPLSAILGGLAGSAARAPQASHGQPHNLVALRKANAERRDAERRYFADIAKTLDACEYAAGLGEDVSSFARLQNLMTRPMADPWNYTSAPDGRSLDIPAANGGQKLAEGLPAPVPAH